MQLSANIDPQNGKSSAIPHIGILFTNIGSPQAPTPRALRAYLKEFLSDPRIIDWPRWLWLPILYGIVLTFRPKRSARLYKNIWDNGSPLLSTMEKQVEQIQTVLNDRGCQNIIYSVGMRYGSPSISNGLKELKAQGVKRILVFPLFPQYSSTTTASTYDAVFEELITWSWIPEIHLISDYHDHPDYIEALADSVLEAWEQHGSPEKLLFSYHGVPKRYMEGDDSYRQQCLRTSQLVAQQLELSDDSWKVSFQSRFGPEEWLQPYTDATIEKWGHDRLTSVQVICPGFSSDCLETIDEIDREARDIFEHAGGKMFHYIPALNNQQAHAEALAKITLEHIRDLDQELTINLQPQRV